MLTITLQRRELSIMKNKKFKVGASLAALTTLAPMAMPFVGAEEAATAEVKPADATQAKAISLEIVNKNSAQGAKFTAKSPVTLRAKIKLPEGVKEGTVTLALNEQFKFLENKVTGADGQETTEVAKIRILKGNTAHRELDGSQLPTVKDEKKEDEKPVSEDKKEETTVASDKKEETTVAAETKPEETTVAAETKPEETTVAADKKEETTVAAENPAPVVTVPTTDGVVKPKASLNVMFDVVEGDLEDGVLTFEVDLMPVEDAASAVRELEVKFKPKGEATEIAEKASITLEKADEVAPYITKFVDAEGNVLADEQSGDAFVDAKEIPGYVLEKTDENDHIRIHTYKKVSAETPETPVTPEDPNAQPQPSQPNNGDTKVDANGDAAPAGDQAQPTQTGSNASGKRLPNTGAAGLGTLIVAGFASVGGAMTALIKGKKGKGLK